MDDLSDLGVTESGWGELHNQPVFLADEGPRPAVGAEAIFHVIFRRGDCRLGSQIRSRQRTTHHDYVLVRVDGSERLVLSRLEQVRHSAETREVRNQVGAAAHLPWRHSVRRWRLTQRRSTVETGQLVC